MRTKARHKYEYPHFPKGRIKQFALELAQFSNISASDGTITLSKEVDGFEIISDATEKDLENFFEIGTTFNDLLFIYNKYHVFFGLDTTSKTLDVLYMTFGDLEATKKFIAFVEKALGLSRHWEPEISELTEGHSHDAPDTLKEGILKFIEGVDNEGLDIIWKLINENFEFTKD